MRIPLLTLVINVIFLQGSVAQKTSPDKILHQFRDLYQPEKVYLHTDKDHYLSGETVWFKAYLYSGFTPSKTSANLFTELVGKNGEVIKRQLSPINESTASGQVDVPANLETGTYLLRSYTHWMLNFDPAFFFYKTIKVYNPSAKQAQNASNRNAPSLHFFPEGGYLVNDLFNVIAYKATDANGLPISATMSIKDWNGKEVMTSSSLHDGMGKFEIYIKPNKQYTADVVYASGIKQSVPLPVPVDTALALKVGSDSAELSLLISRNDKSDNTWNSLQVIGQMQQNVVLRAGGAMKNGVLKIQFPKADLTSGICQLTVFSSRGIPLAERLIFIRNDEYKMKGMVAATQTSFDRKSKNIIEFSVPDTVNASFSIAVTDADRELYDVYGQNIYSSMLLSSDIRGYVHQPSWYFLNDDSTTIQSLDLLMMTNGWRRFSWQKILNGDMPAIQHKGANYLSLAGTVYSADTKKTVLPGELKLYVQTRDSINSLYQANVDEKGRFSMNGIVVEDSVNIFYQYNPVKGKVKPVVIVPDSNFVEREYFEKMEWPGFLPADTSRYFPSAELLITSSDITKAGNPNARVLQEVVVKTKKKTPTELVSERYTKGVFSTSRSTTIDLVNNPTPFLGSNPIDFVKQQVISGLMFMPDKQNFIYRGNYGTRTNVPTLYYLDEFEVDENMLKTLTMSQIALVKFFPPGISVANAPNGILAFYTKKGGDMPPSITRGMNHFSIAGYSVNREFYAPDYTVEDNKQPDYRSTLYWNSDILLDATTKSKKIIFYNNDSAKRFRVIIEGMNQFGELLHLEQIIGPEN